MEIKSFNELRVPAGEPGSINYTKNKRLNEIKEYLSDKNVEAVFFEGDANKNGVIDPKDYFVVKFADGSSNVYYNVAKGDLPSSIAKKMGISLEQLIKDNNLKLNKNNEPIIQENNFLKIVFKSVDKADMSVKKSAVPVQPKQDNFNVPETEVSVSKPVKSFELKYNPLLLHNESFVKYKNGLEKYKEKLLVDLKLSSEEYDYLAQLSLAIIEAETKSGINKKGYPLLRSINNVPSIGISNIKMSNFANDHAILDKYGITHRFDKLSNIHSDDEKAAIATIILLVRFKNDYQYSYIPNIALKYNDYTKDRRLNLAEYIAARWKGYRLSEFDVDPDVRAKAHKYVDEMVKYRNSDEVPSDETASYIMFLHNKYTNQD